MKRMVERKGCTACCISSKAGLVLMVSIMLLGVFRAPAWSTSGCKITLLSVNVLHVSKSAYLFDEKCFSSGVLMVTFKVNATWDGSKQEASEWFKGEIPGPKRMEGGIVYNCPADPWLNSVNCTIKAVTGNPPTPLPNPVTYDALSAEQKANFKAAISHSSPEIQAPKEGYSDTDGDKKVILIVKAAPGETSEPGNDFRFWKYNLQFQTKEGDSWKTRDVLPFISPAAATTAANRIVTLDFGFWRVRAQTMSPLYPTGMWSEWRNFHVGAQLALKAPSDLKADFRHNYGPGMLLSWKDNSDNEAGFEIQRWNAESMIRGVESIVGRVDAGKTEFIDKDIRPGVRYAYQVRAIPLKGGGIVSEWSNEAQATASAAWNQWRPTNLSAYRVSATSVRLTWKDNSNGEAGFDVERMDFNKKTPSWNRVGSTRTDETSYTDPGLSVGVNYGYRVRAYGSGNLYSSYSNEVLVKSQGEAPAVQIGTKSQITTKPPSKQFQKK